MENVRMSNDMSGVTSCPEENVNSAEDLSTWDDIRVSIHHEGGCDLEEVKRAIPILFAPGDWHELRPLPSARSQVICADYLNAACCAVEAVCDQQVYYSLNPIQHGEGRASKKTVTNRRWFLIDVDTLRPDINTSATDEEKEASGQLAIIIVDYLISLGWTSPLIIDSGNGWHLLYRVDLPNDTLSQQILKSCLYSLAEKFDNNHGIIDRATHDAPRIAKMPGTWARKGPNTPERPHRLCQIVGGSNAEIVSIDLLQALGAPPKSTNGGTHEETWPFVVGRPNGLVAYVRRAIESEGFKVAMAIGGNRNNVLNRAAFCLGTMADWPEMDEQDTRSTLIRAAQRCGLDSDPGCGNSGILRTIESGWQAGRLEPRKRPVEDSKNKDNVKTNGLSRFIIWASTVKPRKVEWIDPGRIPRGKMTTFAGQTGVGKTFTVCDLAARITTGREIPFGGGACYPCGKVLIISAEDDADDTIVPRFIELGGDLSKLALLSPECEEKFSLSALELLNGCIADMGRDVLMVAIDPPTSYLGKVDDHRNAELRGLLTPLRNWARDNRIALVFVTHVNKPSAFKIDAMARVMGSVAWVAAVRSAHMFCPDPMNPTRNLYLPLKVNNAKKRKGLAYEIVPRLGDLATLQWLEEVDTTADDAMNQIIPKKTSGQEAVEWLIIKFRQKAEWRSEDLAETAREECVSERAIFKSSEVRALPIVKRQTTDKNGERYWTWKAKPGWPPRIAESE